MALRFLLGNYPLLDMARFGVATLYLRLTPWWQPLEKVTAADWARRWHGPRLYDLLWRTLLVGKFGEDNLNVVNMAWLWERLHARTTRLCTFIGGFHAFMDKLADGVRGPWSEVRLNISRT